MTDVAEIARLRELRAKATPGPWHLLKKDGNKPRTVYAADEDLRYIARCKDGPCFHSPTPDDDNAALIVAAVNALLALLDGAERTRELEAEVEALKQRGAEAVIAYHVAICSPKGVVPNDSLYDPTMAADIQARMDAARTALTGQGEGG